MKYKENLDTRWCAKELRDIVDTSGFKKSYIAERVSLIFEDSAFRLDTLSHILNGRRLPSLERYAHILIVCGLAYDDAYKILLDFSTKYI